MKKNKPSKNNTTAQPCSPVRSYLALIVGGAMLLIVVGIFVFDDWRSAHQLAKDNNAQELDEQLDDIYEVEAEILAEDITLYNDYFAFNYLAPQNWAVYDWWDTNVATRAGQTSDFKQFEGNGTANRHLIRFIDLGNERYSSGEQHFDITLDALKLAGVSSTDDVLAADEQQLITNSRLADGYLLKEQQEIMIAGRSWQLRLYQSTSDEQPFSLLRLATPLKDDYFLTVESTYWLANPGAYEQIINHLGQSLSFK